MESLAHLLVVERRFCSWKPVNSRVELAKFVPKGLDQQIQRFACLMQKLYKVAMVFFHGVDSYELVKASIEIANCLGIVHCLHQHQHQHQY